MKEQVPIVRDAERQVRLRDRLRSALEAIGGALNKRGPEFDEVWGLHYALECCDEDMSINLMRSWYDTRRIAISAYDLARRLRHNGRIGEDECEAVYQAAGVILDAPTFHARWPDT